jgi:hypothetical protein
MPLDTASRFAASISSTRRSNACISLRRFRGSTSTNARQTRARSRRARRAARTPRSGSCPTRPAPRGNVQGARIALHAVPRLRDARLGMLMHHKVRDVRIRPRRLAPREAVDLALQIGASLHGFFVGRFGIPFGLPRGRNAGLYLCIGVSAKLKCRVKRYV